MAWLLKYYKWIYIALVAAGGVPALLGLWSAQAAGGYFILVLAALVRGLPMEELVLLLAILFLENLLPGRKGGGS